MELQPCVRCGKALRQPAGINTTGDKQVAFYITAVTVGIRPRIVSRAKRSVVCLPCAIAIAMAPAPEGAFNMSVYETLNDMNGRDRVLINEAWDQKTSPSTRPRLMPGSKPDDTLTSPLLKTPALAAAG